MSVSDRRQEGMEVSAPSKKFPVYIIYSQWSLAAIEEYLSPFGGAKYLRIIYDFKTCEETNRTLAVLADPVYEALVAKGADRRTQDVDFSITRFMLRQSHYPGKDKSSRLFIQVPPMFRNDEAFVRKAVTAKLRELSEWGILPNNSWSMYIPLRSRETGEMRSGCYLSFRRDVSIDAVALAKICVNDTYWQESPVSPAPGAERLPTVLCFWARERAAKGAHAGEQSK